mmetsp:Transcript_3706/g.13638  ORF Transcript_3706/g.13638 Transcript_3706/m.13638 type:complete len:284 (-) Transcript_3706:6253-7104(-)
MVTTCGVIQLTDVNVIVAVLSESVESTPATVVVSSVMTTSALGSELSATPTSAVLVSPSAKSPAARPSDSSSSPATSSSTCVMLTACDTASYCPSALVATRSMTSDASGSSTSSFSAVTVTVCAMSQLLSSKVSRAAESVISDTRPAADCTDRSTCVVACGADVSVTSNVASSPSSMVSELVSVSTSETSSSYTSTGRATVRPEYCASVVTHTKSTRCVYESAQSRSSFVTLTDVSMTSDHVPGYASTKASPGTTASTDAGSTAAPVASSLTSSCGSLARMMW